MGKSLKCPLCKRELVRGRMRRYETITEHGFEPNKQEYPLRETFVCTCKESEFYFWDNYGDLYTGDAVFSLWYSTLQTHKESQLFRRMEAINSESRKFHINYEWDKILSKIWIYRSVKTLRRSFYLWKLKHKYPDTYNRFFKPHVK